MVASAGLRIGVAGATGALGSELVELLDASRIPVAAFVPMASERSLGTEVEFRDEAYSVRAEAKLPSLDLLFLCAPPEVSRGLLRSALRAQLPCLDLSGALAAQEEVPLLAADLPASREMLGAPVIAVPTGVALAASLVLAPLDRVARVIRAVVTVLEGASRRGRAGMQALSAETVALLSQQEMPEPEVFPRRVAFDCVPLLAAEGREERSIGTPSDEEAFGRDVRRLAGDHLRLATTFVQVPTFTGQGVVLHVQTEQPLDPREAALALSKAPGVECCTQDPHGPSVRESVGRDTPLVGLVRRDTSVESGLALWLALDALRVTAANAIRLAEARLGLV